MVRSTGRGLGGWLLVIGVRMVACGGTDGCAGWLCAAGAGVRLGVTGGTDGRVDREGIDCAAKLDAIGLIDKNDY